MRTGMDSGIRIRSDFIFPLANPVESVPAGRLRSARAASGRPPARTHCYPQQNTALGAIAFFARVLRPTLGSTSHGASMNEVQRFTGILEVPIMKRLIQAVAITLAISTPLAAQAQSNQPLTRAQVRAEVKALKQAGFQSSDWFYPASIVSAEAKIARQHDAGYGSDRGASSESGQ